MKISENDIISLDFIIDKIIELGYSISSQELTNAGIITEKDNMRIEYEFQRLLTVVEHYDVAQVHSNKSWYTVEPNKHTYKFKENGGFKTLFQEELNRIEKEEEREKLEIDLAKSNLEANELNKSIAAKNEINKKKNKTERIINISIGILNLVLLVVQVLISLYKS